MIEKRDKKLRKIRKKILIVEDDKYLAHGMGLWLKARGYYVVSATRFSEALERLAEGGIDLVLLDLGLPDSQGLDTYSKVHVQAQETPIVVLTGLNDEKIAIKAVQEGTQDYLVKGEVDSKLLIRSINYAIERHRLLTELVKLQKQLLKAERFRVMVETAGAAAHEINQPLTVLIGMTERLMKKLDPDDPERYKLEAIFGAGEEIKVIVQKMRTARKYVTKPYLNGIDIVDFNEAAEQEGPQVGK